MKAIILAGGSPSAVSEQDERIPKPMAEIGGHPIIWHIMKHLSHYGIDEFIICAGYRSEVIKEYFSKFYIYNSDITVDLGNDSVEIINKQTENWKVTVLDTGIKSSVTSRIKKAIPYIGNEDFIVTYGDCVSDMNLSEMIAYHHEMKKTVTISVAHPIGRSVNIPIDEYGNYAIIEDTRDNTKSWIDACVFIFSPNISGYLDVDSDFIHEDIIPRLARDNQVATFRHDGFWSSMETFRDRSRLDNLWKKNRAPWKVWNE